MTAAQRHVACEIFFSETPPLAQSTRVAYEPLDWWLYAERHYWKYLQGVGKASGSPQKVELAVSDGLEKAKVEVPVLVSLG